jgi:hypothetical protein
MHNLSVAAMEDDRIVSAFLWTRRGLEVAPSDPGLRRLRSRILTRLAWNWTLGLPTMLRSLLTSGTARIRSIRHPRRG